MFLAERSVITNERVLTRADLSLVAISCATFILAASCEYANAGEVAIFGTSALGIASLAALVGRSVDHLGDRLGSGATGFLQSALANLPELFIGIFALRAGLIGVIQSALIGSILANVVLVLGISFIAGGVRHGTQRFSTEAPRMTLMLLVLAAAIIMIPTLSSHLGTAGAHHEIAMSNIAAGIALVIFLLSVPASLKHSGPKAPELLGGPIWPIWLVVLVLGGASFGALFVSDWFIAALTPAMASLHVSRTFAGLVIVAIAGSAIENFVGIKLALQNRPDYSLAVILQSPVQIALGLIPALVLLSNFVGPTPLTLVLPTMLFAVLALSIIVAVVIVFDGESTWLEGAALVGFYVLIATAFWWS
jgi:Ca2+:H+ antiporter